MEEYTFPKRGEIRARLKKVWPQPEYDGLIERLARLSEKTVTADGLVSCLSLAIEDFVHETERSPQFRMSVYANLPPAIRALVPERSTRAVTLNEYVNMIWRLEKLEGK